MEKYREYREVGRDLNTKVIRAELGHDEIMASANLLGIAVGEDEVLYDREEDTGVHMDFALHEYRPDDRTPIELFYENEAWDTEVERTLLASLIDADTSLFRVTSVNEEDNLLRLQDVLMDDEEIALTDIGFSRTAEPGVLLFIRPVSLDEFTMTSGMSLPFASEAEDHLIDTYNQVNEGVTSRPESVTRFVTFYRLSQTIGLDVRYL